jgi:hypothetical protein
MWKGRAMNNVNNNEIVYLYSKRDIANIIRDLAESLVQIVSGAEWYREHGTLVQTQALEIWLHRFNNYEQYIAGVRAANPNALFREGA